jgi:hypothetical protein
MAEHLLLTCQNQSLQWMEVCTKFKTHNEHKGALARHILLSLCERILPTNLSNGLIEPSNALYLVRGTEKEKSIS